MNHGYRPGPPVLVVTVGRCGDHLRSRADLSNAGFGVITGRLRCCCPSTRSAAATAPTGDRLAAAAGGADGSMLQATRPRSLTDAVPEQRGFALGTNSGGALRLLIGLVAGGVLASIDWRLIFWVNVPVRHLWHGVGSLLGAARDGERHRSPIRLVGEHHLRRWASARCWSESPTASSLRPPHDGFGPARSCSRPVIGRARCAGRLRVHRIAGAGADDPARPVQASALSVPQPREPRDTSLSRGGLQS